MKSISSFRHGLRQIRQEWSQERFDGALAEVERLLTEWPDNPLLLRKRGELIQLQAAAAAPSLDEARLCLRRACELDEECPVPLVELACFLLNVDDDSEAAGPFFAQAISLCRAIIREAESGQSEVGSHRLVRAERPGGRPSVRGVQQLFVKTVRQALGDGLLPDLTEFDTLLEKKPPAAIWHDKGDGVEATDVDSATRLVRSEWRFSVEQGSENSLELAKQKSASHAERIASCVPQGASIRYMILLPPALSKYVNGNPATTFLRGIVRSG